MVLRVTGLCSYFHCELLILLRPDLYSIVHKRKLKDMGNIQARNRLGAPGRAKSFLRGPKSTIRNEIVWNYV